MKISEDSDLFRDGSDKTDQINFVVVSKGGKILSKGKAEVFLTE